MDWLYDASDQANLLHFRNSTIYFYYPICFPFLYLRTDTQRERKIIMFNVLALCHYFPANFMFYQEICKKLVPRFSIDHANCRRRIGICVSIALFALPSHICEQTLKGTEKL